MKDAQDKRSEFRTSPRWVAGRMRNLRTSHNPPRPCHEHPRQNLIATPYALRMPWYQSAGIVIAAVLGLFTLLKTLREIVEPYRLSSRMKKARDLADKATGKGAEAVLSAEAETLAAKLAARRAIRYSGRDKLSATVFFGAFGLFLAPMWIQLGDPRIRLALGLLAFVVYQIAMARFLPRLQTVKFQRELFVRLQAPLEPIRALSIPSGRDYMFRTTITPDLILDIARRVFDAVATGVDLVAAVNLTIETLESSIYQRKPQKP